MGCSCVTPPTARDAPDDRSPVVQPGHRTAGHLGGVVGSAQRHGIEGVRVAQEPGHVIGFHRATLALERVGADDGEHATVVRFDGDQVALGRYVQGDQVGDAFAEEWSHGVRRHVSVAGVVARGQVVADVVDQPGDRQLVITPGT